MQFLTLIKLIFKYLPLILDLVKKLEENVSEQVLNFEIRKDKEKIDLIFKEKGNDAQRASNLNDIFRK